MMTLSVDAIAAQGTTSTQVNGGESGEGVATLLSQRN